MAARRVPCPFPDDELPVEPWRKELSTWRCETYQDDFWARAVKQYDPQWVLRELGGGWRPGIERPSALLRAARRLADACSSEETYRCPPDHGAWWNPWACVLGD